MKKTIIIILLAIVAVAGQAKKQKKFDPAQIQASMVVPSDWFKTDTICIKGRIEGYDAEQFGFTSMEYNCHDIFNKSGGVIVMDIAPDGTFEKSFQASYPIFESFYASGSKVGFEVMSFFARPGETIDITVRKGEKGQWECFYNSGSSKEVEHWLKSNLNVRKITEPLYTFKGTFAEANKYADKVWQQLMDSLQAVSRREDFTPFEMQLALADAQADFVYMYMEYARFHGYDLVKQERDTDGTYHQVILDSMEYEALRDTKNYVQLRRIDFDNPLLLLSSGNYHILLNSIQFSEPVHKTQFKGIKEEGRPYLYGASVEKDRQMLANILMALREMMGTDKDNMLAQCCLYKTMLDCFDDWRESGVDSTLDKLFPVCLDALKHPYIHQKAKQYYDRKMAQTELTLPLPEDNPAANLIRRLSAKYPGRYLFIDFWGMGCGPCRSAIQSSKEKRAGIARRDDVKLVFIAGERTAEGSEAYHKYVDEWLAGEEAVCVTNQDFTRLQELFCFTAIPHYEIITPDCYRVREDLQILGFYNFDSEFKKLKEKLK